MWGTQVEIGPRINIVRFIPTHVGNSAKNERTVSSGAVHPHACGELIQGDQASGSPPGSSPRMWGTLWQSASYAARSRFIPTHVGNSDTNDSSLLAASVHPHACGELFLIRSSRSALIGSSPRMWGTLKKNTTRSKKDRFIPTHVGNSGRSAHAARHRSVHPHACGELFRLKLASLGFAGSSPRMWGTPGPRAGPAVAGLVHPHACGELASTAPSVRP